MMTADAMLLEDRCHVGLEIYFALGKGRYGEKENATEGKYRTFHKVRSAA
jgi:hypothetical protein